MAMARAILAVAAVAALAAVQLAAAVDHPVGGTGSWDASGNSYDAWSAKQTFKQGDTLSFKFASSHDVTEVNKAAYDACSGANPIKSYSGGSATVKLTAPGKRYFICSVPGHCAAGMKLEVTVAAAAVTAPAPAKSSKPRHQRSVAPTPAPAMAPEPSSTDEMPNLSTPTAAPAPKSSDAASIVGMLGAKAVAAEVDMAPMARAIVAVVAVAALAVQLAAAVDHPVGGNGAWDASGTSYNAWSAKQAFVQGDTMSFKYAASHDVTEVTKAGYDACSGANPVKSYTGGATTVKLAAPGKRYFICSVPGHCAAGMKVEVTVAAAAVTAPAVTAPAPAKSRPRHQRSVAPAPAPTMAPEPSSVSSTDGLPTVSTPTAAPAPKPSGAASIGMLGAKAGVALAIGMAFALAI
ncbi:hypothetical protein BAE44_0001543 [Dichanthelium oligosanthes]|uniref:Phytocyanin domain-containing protein n=1 Tax=Dichanthelium oligosanthes TaxID=888268 RepID=A0A1E5WJA7_9POAL|nr:hypothetical protein BAE44_0001543 [Dichanthelium oligosanthes]